MLRQTMAIVRYRDAVYETTKRLNPANISNFLDILLYDRRKKELLQFSDQDGRFAINSDVSVKEEQLGRHHKTVQRTQIAVPSSVKRKEVVLPTKASARARSFLLHAPLVSFFNPTKYLSDQREIFVSLFLLTLLKLYALNPSRLS